MAESEGIQKNEWDLLTEMYMEGMTAVLEAHYPQSKINRVPNARDLLSAKERECVDRFKRFIEIINSLESMDLILKLAKRRPARDQAEPMKVLRFYIEAYLQETYILRERLLRWIRFEKKFMDCHEGC